MNPTNAQIDTTITRNVILVKACGHQVQAKLLQAQTRFGLIDDKKDALFDHAYRQVNEISTFPVDTDQAMNRDVDTDGLKAKAEMSYSRTTEFKVAWTGIKPNPSLVDAYDDAMKLVDDALETLQEARDYAQVTIDATRAAVKLRKKEDETEAEA